MVTADVREDKSSGMLRPMLVFLRGELAPKPGRLADATRITVLTVLVVIISETFQIPLVAYSAYIVFFLSKEEAASTILIGILATLAITVSVLSALAIYMLSSGEPGLRFPLMAAMTIGGMFISRASPLGLVGFVIGFLITVSLTLIDTIPRIGPLPSTEILTRSVLWLWCIVMLPIVLVIIGNILTGRDPIELFKNGLSDRLQIAGRVLSEKSGNPANRKRLAVYAESGSGGLLNYLKMAGIFHKELADKKAANQAVVAQTVRLIMLLTEWVALEVSAPHLVAAASACGDFLLAAGRSVKMPTAILPIYPKPSIQPADGKAGLLLAAIAETAETLPVLLASRNTVNGPAPSNVTAEKAHHSLLAPDAFTNPDYFRYALKTTLAIFIAYITYSMLDWPDIRTSMITCFFVALGSFGETAHKMSLRITGAVIGGGLGLLTIIFIMPYLTEITGLCLIVAAISFFAGWVGTSSESLSYAGLQIALAFFFSTLVGYGPTVDLTLARDRVVGILFGNVIIFIVFSIIWPVSVGSEARKLIAAALDKLSKIFSGDAQGEPDATVLALSDDLAQARRLVFLNPFEPKDVRHGHTITADMQLLNAVQALCGPAIILEGQKGPRGTYNESLGLWLSNVSRHMSGETAGESPKISTLANEPKNDQSQAAAYLDWQREVDKRVYILDTLIKGSTISGDIPINQAIREGT